MKGLRPHFYLIVFALVVLGFWIKRKEFGHSTPDLNSTKPEATHDSMSPAVPRLIKQPAMPQTPETNAKLILLRAILSRGNDNDPRLDSEFRNLSPELKSALKSEYQNLAPEKRNARGTLVFLLGREIRKPEDLSFFEEVLNETPCGSLEDCSRTAANQLSRDHDAEPNTAVEVTLAYPQLVALKSMERVLSDPNAPASIRERARNAVQQAQNSRVKVVADSARKLYLDSL